MVYKATSVGNNCKNTSLVFLCFVLHFFCSLITIPALSVPHWSVRKMGMRDKIPRKNDVFSQLPPVTSPISLLKIRQIFLLSAPLEPKRLHPLSLVVVLHKIT